MSGGLYVNKIAFTILATGLTVIGLNEASHAFFHTAHHEQPGYAVAIPEAAGAEGAEAAEEGPVDYGVLLSAADPAAGEQVAVKCHQCHTIEASGGNLQGPPLWGLMGRDIAAVAGFKYSDDMAAQEGVWDYAKLDHFLERPKAMVPGTAMNFVGLKKQQDRMNLMAFLKTQTSGAQLEFPAPLPPQAVDAAAPADGAVPVEGAVPAEGGAPAEGAPAAPANGAAPAPAAPAPAQPAPAAPAPATPTP